MCACDREKIVLSQGDELLQGAHKTAAFCVLNVLDSQWPSQFSCILVFFIFLYSVVPAVTLEAESAGATNTE